MSQSEPPVLTDQQRWKHEQNRAMAERVHDRHDEAFRRMNETAINASHIALRTILLINGAAAIALLSFDGRLPAPQAKAVAGTLIWFALGVVAITVAMILAYWTHYTMAGALASATKTYEYPFIIRKREESRWLFSKSVLHILAAVFTTASLGLFVRGMLAVRAAILG